jgi:dipeptidyl aminopeptidase/acylaminoacyl peptidase
MNLRIKAGLCAGAVCAFAISILPVVRGQESSAPRDAEKPHAMSKSGKKLFGAMDALRVHGISNVRVSDDGSRIAFTATELAYDTEGDPSSEMKTRTQLWVFSQGSAEISGQSGHMSARGSSSDARQFTFAKQSVSSPSWSPDGSEIAFLRGSEDKENERQVWFINVNGGEAEKITNHKGGFASVAFSPDGKQLLLSAADQPTKEDEARRKLKDDAIVVDHDLRMAHMWLFDIASKKETRLTDGDFTASDLEWSPDGKMISFTAHPSSRADDADDSTVWILNPATKEKHKLIASQVYNHTGRWSPDGKSIAYLVVPYIGGVKKTDLYVVSADSSNPRKLTGSFDNDAGTPVWSPDGKTIYFSTNTRETDDLFAVNVANASVTQITQSNGAFALAALSKDGSTAFGTFSDSEHPGEVARVSLADKSIARLTDVNHFLDDYAMGETEIAKWKSTDGTEIEGVLYKPVDFDPSKKYPFLLNPHGGPTGASTLSFSAGSQIMAANGYLVLQPNFRGSTGRGEAFAEANHNDWGKGDYQDCISGVKSIVARGIADPNRLGAYGWSYGGYMTFWILTQTDMFKAISPGAGLTDLAAMYAHTDIQHYVKWFFDDKYPWQDEQIWWDHSPMKYVNNVKTPALILQGQVDTRVPMAQAQEMYRALVDRGIPVEFVLYPRENHGFTEPKHIEDRYQRYLTFFGKYLDNPPVTDAVIKDAPVAAAAADVVVSSSSASNGSSHQ